MKLGDRISSINQELVRWCERIIALALLFAVICFFLATLRIAFGLDWSAMATLHEIGQRVLLITIGLELVRTLISHESGFAREFAIFCHCKENARTANRLLGNPTGSGRFRCTHGYPALSYRWNVGRRRR